MIIDYWNKNIEFELIDYPVEKSFLKEYKIRDITIIHRETEILIKSFKKDLIASVGIFYNKWEAIEEDYKNFIETNLLANNQSINLSDCMKEDIIFKKCAILNLNEYTFQIKSYAYNLLNEKGIICYYNLNDEYHNTILDEILKNN